jgi:hypothetical protein
MKRKFLPLIIVILFASNSINAQLKKGNVLLGAAMGINYSTVVGLSSGSNTNISPRISLAVGEHSTIGVLGNFGYSQMKDNPDSKSTSTSYGAGLFWKKFLPIKNKLGWYLETDASVTGANNVQYYQGIKSKVHYFGYNAGVVPGLYYQALPKLILSANVGGVAFSHQDSKSSVTEHFSTLNFNLFSSFMFSFDFVMN